jgi:hypothetical protein
MATRACRHRRRHHNRSSRKATRPCQQGGAADDDQPPRSGQPARRSGLPNTDQVAGHLQEERGVERVEEGREMSERVVLSSPSLLLTGLLTSYSGDGGGENRRQWVELCGVEWEPPVSPRGGRRGGLSLPQTTYLY